MQVCPWSVDCCPLCRSHEHGIGMYSVFAPCSTLHAANEVSHHGLLTTDNCLFAQRIAILQTTKHRQGPDERSNQSPAANSKGFLRSSNVSMPLEFFSV
jgi:hypothetical protein